DLDLHAGGGVARDLEARGVLALLARAERDVGEVDLPAVGLVVERRLRVLLDELALAVDEPERRFDVPSPARVGDRESRANERLAVYGLRPEPLVLVLFVAYDLGLVLDLVHGDLESGWRRELGWPFALVRTCRGERDDTHQASLVRHGNALAAS